MLQLYRELHLDIPGQISLLRSGGMPGAEPTNKHREGDTWSHQDRDTGYSSDGRNSRIRNDSFERANDSALRGEQEPLLERIVKLQATTLPGLQAKAATLALWDLPTLYPEDVYWNERLAASLLGDLLGVDTTSPGAARAAHDALVVGTFKIGIVGAAAWPSALQR